MGGGRKEGEGENLCFALKESYSKYISPLTVLKGHYRVWLCPCKKDTMSLSPLHVWILDSREILFNNGMASCISILKSEGHSYAWITSEVLGGQPNPKFTCVSFGFVYTQLCMSVAPNPVELSQPIAAFILGAFLQLGCFYTWGISAAFISQMGLTGVALSSVLLDS